MRSFFLGSPKKPQKVVPARVTPLPALPVHRLQNNLARYLRENGTLAQTLIKYKEIAQRCDVRLLESDYALIGQKMLGPGSYENMQVGKLTVQTFRLPPLPGVPSDQLPQSLDECLKGLSHARWHRLSYMQGTLTQSGGDCVVSLVTNPSMYTHSRHHRHGAGDISGSREPTWLRSMMSRKSRWQPLILRKR